MSKDILMYMGKEHMEKHSLNIRITNNILFLNGFVFISNSRWTGMSLFKSNISHDTKIERYAHW